MGTCCSAGSRICQPFDPCQGVSWTVRPLQSFSPGSYIPDQGAEPSGDSVSSDHYRATRLACLVRNHEKFTGDSRSAAVPLQYTGSALVRLGLSLVAPLLLLDKESNLWVTSLVDEAARTLGRSDDYLAPPLTPVSIISGMVTFTGISQSTIWLTFYPHLPVC